MTDKKLIHNLSIKICDLYKVREVIDESEYEEKMTQYLIELLAESSISDEEYETRKNSLRYYGFKKSDILEALQIGLNEL